MPVLHQMHVSGNCYKARLCARQAGFPLTLKDYGLFDGDTRKPAFLARNPNGRVPLLELDDGRCLPESGAILAYIAEGTPLVPGDRWGRAQMLQWMFFEQYSHEPCIAVARFILRYLPADHPRRAELPRLAERGRHALSVMEQHLAKEPFFAAGRYTVADISLYAYTHCARDGGFDLQPYPQLRAWLERVRTQPGHVPLG